MKDLEATPLRQQIEKLLLPSLDHDFYYERLISYPENEWFQPNNVTHQDYQICSELQIWNLIEKRNEPIWVDGGFRGQRIFFRYKTDLVYGEKH